MPGRVVIVGASAAGRGRPRPFAGAVMTGR
jgi:hypothetical protein